MKKIFITLIAFVPLFFTLTSGRKPPANSDSTITINYIGYRQVIDGFGGSNAWTRLPNDNEAAQEVVDLLYSRTKGMGFTILRNRIPFRERLEGDENPGINDGFLARKSDDTYYYTTNADGSKTFNLNWKSWDIDSTKRLVKYIKDLKDEGPEKLVIMSTPWTPPNNRITQWKEDVTGINDRLNGKIDWKKPDEWGRLKRDKYNDYADLLADYAKNFEKNIGHPLAILSVQNEPGYRDKWESAYWNGTDLRDFLKVIEQRFPKKGIVLGEEGGLGIMMPEFQNFNVVYSEVIKPSIDDSAVNDIITHIALHQYNGATDSTMLAGSKAFPEIIATGKRFWQTEVSGSGSNIPIGNGIDNALFYARMIHFDLTLAETNAFLYWWLWTGNTNDKNFPGALLMVEGETIHTSKRLYAMGQYSRFIRPGWHRIDCKTPSENFIFTSSYRNRDTTEIAIVLISERSGTVNVPLVLENAEFNKLGIWRTSFNENLKFIGPLKTSGNTATVTLPPKSITTIYGTVR